MIYEARAESAAGNVHSFGARLTREEADQLLADVRVRVEKAGGKNSRYWVEDIDDDGLFRIPPAPAPRENYSQRQTPVPSGQPDAWDTQAIDIVTGDEGHWTVAGSYARNYPGRAPFEVFRQGNRTFALIAPNYTATTVMDLETGQIVAGEEPSNGGFCPVGFYVPDWHDIHDGSILPGSMLWEDHYEWPDGQLGFVWGCHWGDDSSWKIQCLDLSGVARGKLTRDDRLGYVPLAADVRLEPKNFIKCWPEPGGEVAVQLYVQRTWLLAPDGSAVGADDD